MQHRLVRPMTVIIQKLYTKTGNSNTEPDPSPIVCCRVSYSPTFVPEFDIVSSPAGAGVP